ncbi:ROK family protein [Naasia sp. SYSU D00948]|uniref:ROK family protein n=1 Tax=Naasia sp. SYSU D00948 TaxID=2817379 RepID=UPI001B30CF57|nr:ROK family protein [Naasia sp. SYSU D00948]
MPRTARAVAVEVLVHGPQSRARLAARMGLSPASLTRLVKPLVSSGVLVEAGAVRTSQLGRSSMPLDVLADDYRFAGVKLTQDTAYAVLTDLRATVLAELSVPLPPRTDPESVVRAVRGVVEDLQASEGRSLDGVGLTLGGRVRDGVVVHSPYLQWRDVPLKSLLNGALGEAGHVENDVVGLTEAEHWFGRGRGHADFALLTVGAGIGYGLVLGGTLVPVETGPAAHLPIDAGGPPCPEGHRGCLASFATTGAITAAVSVGHRRPLAFPEVVALADGGDAIALRVLSEAAWAVGRAAQIIADVTSVRRIILSGEAVLAESAHEPLTAGLTAYHSGEAEAVDVVTHPVDFFEWARGAAVVAIRREFPRGRR